MAFGIHLHTLQSTPMKPISRTPKTILTVLGIAALCIAAARTDAQDTPSEFTSATIDLGVVVSDVQESVDFYTKLIGFAEVPGFAVDEEFCRTSGLTDGHAATIRVLVLNKERGATSLKLMSLPKAEPKDADTAFIHSQLGYSYITIKTVSLQPALERLKRAGITPLADGPIPLPGAGADGPHLAVVRDPDGNLVELIGTL